MKYLVYLLVFTASLLHSSAQAGDTIYLEEPNDIRLQHYHDSLLAYTTGFAVAKAIADSVAAKRGDHQLDGYFLGRYAESMVSDEGFFFDYNESPKLDLGHVHVPIKGIKSDPTMPWQFIETQYKRLDTLKVLPAAIIQGAELPNVYVYAPPANVVIYRKVRRYTVVDPSIKFYKKDDGKTKVSYILKYYYIKEENKHERIDSIQKLDPVTLKPVYLE